MPNARVPAAAGGLLTDTTRRRALTALAGLGAVASLPAIAAAKRAADPIPQLYAKAMDLTAYINNEDGARSANLGDAQLNALMDRVGEMERQAAATVPITAAGALVALQWASQEVEEARQWGDRRDNFIVEMLTRVSDYLRQEGGAA